MPKLSRQIQLNAALNLTLSLLWYVLGDSLHAPFAYSVS